MRKFTYKEVSEYISSIGCKLISNEYKNNSVKVEIIFSCGHLGFRTFSDIKVSAPLCARCTGHGTDSYENIKYQFEKNEYLLLEKTYVDTQTKMNFKDKEGYKYFLNYSNFINNINSNRQFQKFGKSNPHTLYNIRLWLKLNKPNVFLYKGEEFISARTKMTFYDSQGYFYHLVLDDAKNDRNYGFVHSKNKYSIYNLPVWLRKNNSSLSLIGGQKYVGRYSPLFFDCKKCGESNFERTWADMYEYGGKCPYCIGRRVGKYNNLLYVHPNIASDWDYSKNKKSPEEYNSCSNNRVYWKCKKCSKGWKASINSRTGSLKSGCPSCRQSKGEKIIEKFLLENNIEFIKQYYFPDCRDKSVLKFDFGILKNQNLSFLIEYDGELHFKPYRKIEKAEERLKSAKRRDRIKNKYCKKNNIYLLRIPYWKFDKIEVILKKTFFG